MIGSNPFDKQKLFNYYKSLSEKRRYELYEMVKQVDKDYDTAYQINPELDVSPWEVMLDRWPALRCCLK